MEDTDSSTNAGGTLLIATVGTGRNRADIAEAIAFSLQQQGATCAVFLCSEKTGAETLPEIEKRLRWTSDRYEIRESSNEDDVQELFLEWNGQWSDWVARFRPDEVIVDFTSGTKPMSAAAFALAVARGARRVSYVTGPRDATGRVEKSTDVQSIRPELIVAHRQLRLAVEHFHAGSYAAARDIAAGYLKFDDLPDDRLPEVARSLNFLGGAYEAWDRFDWKAARKAFRESKRFWRKWSWIEDAARLRANYELVEAAHDSRKKNTFAPALCADLLGNTDRCLHRQAWDDAVVRLYRACELLAQMKLLGDHDQRTSNVDPLKLPNGVRADYATRKECANGGKLKLGLEESYALLEKLADPLGAKFRRCYGTRDSGRGPLQGLLNARNDSLLGHGTTPIGEEKATQLREHVTALARVAGETILDVWLPKARPVRFGAF